MIVAALVVPPLGPGGAAQAATDVGYRDFSYSGVTAPTGQKPESKLWYTADGTWWGSLFNATTKRFEIYKFSRATQTWSATGVVVDERRQTEADARYDAAQGKLYIVSHRQGHKLPDGPEPAVHPVLVLGGTFVDGRRASP